MAKYSDSTLSGLANGFVTRRVSDGSWTNGETKTVEGSAVGPKMVQLYSKKSESNVSLSAGLDSDTHWQYDDKRDKGNYPITHAVRQTANTLHFRSEGISQVPEGYIEYGGLGVDADGANNISITNMFDAIDGGADVYETEDYVITHNTNENYSSADDAFRSGTGPCYFTSGPTTVLDEKQAWVAITFKKAPRVFNKGLVYWTNQKPKVYDLQAQNIGDGDTWVTLYQGDETLNTGDETTATWVNATPYDTYRYLLRQDGESTNGYGQIGIEWIEAPLASTVQVDSITAGGTELLDAAPLILTGSSQAEGINEIITAINNGPTNITASIHPDYPTRITLRGTDATFSSSSIGIATQSVALTKLSDFTAYSDGTVTVKGPAVVKYPDASVSSLTGTMVTGVIEDIYDGVYPDDNVSTGANHVFDASVPLVYDLGQVSAVTGLFYASYAHTNYDTQTFTVELANESDFSDAVTVLSAQAVIKYGGTGGEARHTTFDFGQLYLVRYMRITYAGYTGNTAIYEIVPIGSDPAIPIEGDNLGIFPGAQIVDTFGNEFHITNISSDNQTITTAETLPPDAEWEVARIANAETFTKGGTIVDKMATETWTLTEGIEAPGNGFNIWKGSHSNITTAIIEEQFDGDTSLAAAWGGATGDAFVIDLGEKLTDTVITMKTLTINYIYPGIRVCNDFDGVSGSWEVIYTASIESGTTHTVSIPGSYRFIQFYADIPNINMDYIDSLVGTSVLDGGFKLTSNGTTPDVNHFHALAPNGQDSIIYKPTTGAQITDFGFRLPDNSDWAVNLYGEQGYMAFATKFNLDLTPQNCVIYRKSAEQAEVIATSLATERGGLGVDGDWWYRDDAVGNTWSPARDQARAFAAALEADISNRNPAEYYTQGHPDILTQEQFSKLFLGTDKFAPYVGVRSLAGGAPEFTNIWVQFSAAQTDIKLGADAITVEPIVGSKQVQLTNNTGSTIDEPVDAYILG